jgi:hypothetical protein
VPTGKYKISQPIIFKTKMKLYGDGFSSVIKCDFGSGTTIPNVAGTVSLSPQISALPVLTLAPMICNTGPIQFWSIEDIQFDGQSRNAYGIWFASAYFGTLKNVVFHKIGGRPYSALLSNLVNFSQVSFYECGDGVICYDCLSYSMDAVGFEGCKGNFSFQWRSKTVAYGSLDMRNIYLENRGPTSPSGLRANTIGFMGLGGGSIFGRSFLSSNNSGISALRLFHLFDEGDTITIDAVPMTTQAARGIDLGQITDISPMRHYFGNGARGNAISGYINLLSVDKNPASPHPINVESGSSSNGVLRYPIPAPNGTQPNFVTSLT